MWIQTPGVINWQRARGVSGVRRRIYPLASLSLPVMLSGSCSLSVRYTVMFAKWLWIHLIGRWREGREEDQNCGCKVLICIRVLGVSDLCAIKNVFSVNTFPRPPLFSPICLCSTFTSLNAIAASLCQLTLFHWHGVCFTVSIPLCSARLSFHFVSQSLLCFSLKL